MQIFEVDSHDNQKWKCQHQKCGIELVTQTRIVSYIMPKLFSNVMVKNLQDPGLNNMSL